MTVRRYFMRTALKNVDAERIIPNKLTGYITRFSRHRYAVLNKQIVLLHSTVIALARPLSRY